MKATGIVRKVDDLGRIVVPKECRKILGINTGDPVEFYVDGKCIVIKKYDAADGVSQILENMERSIQMQSDLMTPAQQKALLSKLEEMKLVIKGR